jgi:hypothetical protein
VADFGKCSHLREKGGVLMLLKTTLHLGAKAQYMNNSSLPWQQHQHAAAAAIPIVGSIARLLLLVQSQFKKLPEQSQVLEYEVAEPRSGQRAASRQQQGPTRPTRSHKSNFDL